ncbi:TM2 domain-containing protein [Dongshaea marina]|uniref:TM2 domain-containing protein n=1 Tax=Dongshaea marina TaxID=2047966 RepID=UPI000D3E6D62|nr:TM2 domain-containing protein [Dongshaea marina]
MKGTILEFNPTEQSGLISGEDGNRYQFNQDEWKSETPPQVGGNVDFTQLNKQATAIYAEVIPANISAKKITAALLAFFLGAFGAHKFYLGYTKQGVIMLLVFLFGFILLGIPSMIIGIIAFIEFILYLIKSDDEFEKTYIIGKHPWF